MLTAIMVEKNNEEERLARIEQVIEALQQQSVAARPVAAKIDALQMPLEPNATPRRRRTRLNRPTT
jgi:hypothetical protein